MGRIVRNKITLTAVMERNEDGVLSVTGEGTASAELGAKLSQDDATDEFVIRGRLGARIDESSFELVVTEVGPAIDPILSTAEVAEMAGIKSDSVRQKLRRYGINHVEGWPAKKVLPLLGVNTG